MQYNPQLCWLRFEAWPIAGIIFLILFCKNTSLPRLTFYASLVFIICASIMGLGYHYTGDWLRGINYSDFQVTEASKLNPNSKLYFVKFFQTIIAFYPSLLIFSVAGSYVLIKKKKMLFYLICIWPIFFLLVYKTLNNTVAPFMRYYVPIGILLIPIGLYGFWQILKAQSKKVKFVFFLAALGLEFTAAQSFKNYYPAILLVLFLVFLWSLRAKVLDRVNYTFIIMIIALGFARKPYAYGGFFHYQNGLETSASWAKENFPKSSFVVLDNSSTNDQTQWCRKSGLMPNGANIIMTWEGLNIDTILPPNDIKQTLSHFGKMYFMTFKTGHLAKYLNAKKPILKA